MYLYIHLPSGVCFKAIYDYIMIVDQAQELISHKLG